MKLDFLRISAARIVLLCCSTLLSFGTLPLQAADNTWDGDISGLWSDLSNWLNATAVPGTSDVATFNSAVGAGGVSIIDLEGGISLGTLIFDTMNVDAYTIGIASTDTITLDNAGLISLNSSVSNNQIIAADLSIENATLNNQSASTLQITGDISGTSAGNKVLTANGGGNVVIDGVLSDGAADEIAIVLDTSNTTLTLNNANTFTGGIGGTTDNTNVVVGNNSALGTGIIKMEGLRLSANTAGIVIANAVSVGPDAAGWRAGGSFDFEVSGLTTVDQSRQFNNSGSGVVTLSGGMTHLAGRPEFVAGDWDITGVLDAPGDSGVGIRINGGSANVTLSGANTYIGDADINSGVLVANNNSALSTGGVGLNGTNTVFEIADMITITNALTVSDNGGNKILRATSGTGTFAGTIDVQETGNRNFDLDAAVDSTLNVTGVISGVGTVDSTGDGTIEFAGSAANTFAGDFHLGDGGASTFNGTTGNKNGFVVLNRSDALGAGTIISRGSQLQAGTTGINVTQDIDVDSGGLRLGGTQDYEISGKIAPVLGSRTFGHYGLDGVTITLSGEIDLDEGGTSRSMTWEGTNAADNGELIISGNITGGGDFIVGNAFDSGDVVISGDNSSHSGNYSFSSGTVLLNSSNAIGTGNIAVGGGTMTIGVTNAVADTAVITQTGGTITFGDGVAESIHSINGTGGNFILGTDAVNGSSDVTLLNNSTIQNMQVGRNSFLRLDPGVNLTVNGTITQLGDNDSLDFDIGAGGTATVVGAINAGDGNGEVNQIGSGTLVLTGAGAASSSFGGGTRIENGTVEFDTIANVDSASSLGDADFLNILQIGSASNAGTLRMVGTEGANSSNRNVQLGDAGGTIEVVEAGQTLTISGIVSDVTSGGDLTLTGAGAFVLSGDNTYTGDTTLSTTGTVTIGSGGTGGTLGAGAGNVTNNTSLIFNTSDNNTYTGVFSGTGGITQSGSGVTTLSGNNTYTGATQVNAGSLSIGGTNISAISVAALAGIGGEGSTTGSITLADTAIINDVDGNTAAVLSTSGLDLTGVSASGITVNIIDAGVDAFEVINYGGNPIGFTAGSGAGLFTTGTAPTASARAGAGFGDTGTAITFDLGFRTNTWKGTDPTNPTFWDVSTTANWQNSTDFVWENGDSAVFDDTASDFTPTLQSAISAHDVTFNNTTNAYTLGSTAGVLTIEGMLNANNTQAVTITTGVAGGTSGLQIDGTGDLAISGVISGANGITKAGTGTTTVTGVRTNTGPTNINAGTLVFVNGAIIDSRAYTIAAGATLEFDYSSGNPNIGSLDLFGGGTFRTSGGNNNLQLTSSGSEIAMDAGALIQVSESTFGFGGATPGDWTLNQSDLQIDGGATFEGRRTALFVDALNGSGILGIGGPTASGPVAGQGIGIRVGINGGGGTFSGTIRNTNSDGQAFTFEKVGAGTLILSGSNSYTGATTVSGGILQIGDSGTTGSIGNNLGDLSIASGAQVDFNRTNTYSFGGNISGAGAININSGTVNLNGATSTHTGTITVATGAALGGETSTASGIVFNPGSLLSVDASTAGAGFTTTGDVDTSNGVAVRIDTAPSAPGAFTVIDYGTWTSSNPDPSVDFSIDAGGFQVSARSSGGTFADDGSVITLDLGYANRTWNAGSWDIGNSASWQEGDKLYFDGDFVAFDDTAASTSVVIADNVAAQSVTFNNTTGNDYNLSVATAGLDLTATGGINFAGSGDVTINSDIVGATSITQSGTGTTRLAGTSSYTGTTTINAGTLVFVDGALSDGRTYSPIAAGATLEFDYSGGNAGDNHGVFNLSGGGTFRKSGSASLTQVSAGSTISMDSGALIHIAEGSYTFGGGGIGSWAGNLSDLRVDLLATFIGSATPTVVDTLIGAGTANFGGGVTLGDDNGSGVFTGIVNVGGTANGNAAIAYSVTKNGTGTQVLSGANSYSGNTTVNAGRLDVNGTLGGNLTVADGASIGGEANYGGTVTFGSTTNANLFIEGSTTAALTAGSDINTSNGVNVFVESSGAGDITVLNYNSGATNNIDISHFTLDGSAPISSRVGSAGPFVNTGSAITIDLGFEGRTWNNSSMDQLWNATSTNWVEGDTRYVDGDLVTFDDTPGSNQTVILSNVGGTLTPGLVTISNATNTYTFTATTTETLTINDGLIVAAASAAAVNINTVLTGSGSVTQSGTGQTTTLGAANTYTGDTIITSGTLALGIDNAINDTSVVRQTGGTLNLNNNVEDSIHSIQASAGVLNFGGTSEITILNDSNLHDISVGTTGTINIADNVTVTQSGTSFSLGDPDSLNFNVGAGAFADMTGSINSGDGNGQVNKSGAGTLRLSSNGSAFGGGTRIDEGVVEATSINNINSASSLGDADTDDTLQIGGLTTSATLRFIGTGGTSSSNRAVQLNDGGGTIDIEEASRTISISGIVSDANTSGSLTKAGSGTLIFSGGNTYSGTTTVNAGTLLIDGDNSGATGEISVQSGATLGGTGTLGGSVTVLNGGTHTAGTATTAGEQTFNSGLTYNNGSTIAWNLIADSTPGTGWDLFDVDGTLTFQTGGIKTFNIDDDSAIDFDGLAVGTMKDFLVWENALAPVGFDPGEFIVNYSGSGFTGGADDGIFALAADGNNIILRFNAVPEPSTFTLLGLGLAAFGWGARKRRRKQTAEAVESE